LGISSDLGAVQTVAVISERFVNLIKAIGLPIAFGVVIGKLLADMGGIEAIANGFISKKD